MAMADTIRSPVRFLELVLSFNEQGRRFRSLCRCWQCRQRSPWHADVHVRAQVCQEVPANSSVAAKGEQRQACALHRTERDDYLSIWRHRQCPLSDNDLTHTLTTHIGDGV